ncbi:hypothetical protein FHN55_20720 [Streptomyces sp. NP160]|uniref:hypothetical protein n=1 Tax=Streptomyces sp. NP160 TaxID=2586637 RepID=UPI00111B7302|nr:hypothetical protein [Streptomyces sp. NP160]TNM59458.1 hypothetical protein FHN55_20720 [Streptomyces sp. NP160]
MDTWIVVSLLAWTGAASAFALLVGRVLTRAEHGERAAGGLQQGGALVPAVVRLPVRPVSRQAQRSAS